MRSFLAVLGGVIAGFLVISLVEMAAHSMYPPPAGLNFSNEEALAMQIAQMPVGAFLMIALAWASGSFVGGLVATSIATGKPPGPAYITGFILLIFGIINLSAIQHPFWFWIVGLIVFMPAAALGHRLAQTP